MYKEPSCTTWVKIYHPVYWFIKDMPYKIKWWVQRCIRGYSDSDLFNVGTSTGRHTLKCLKAFRKYDKSGYPADMSEEEWDKTLSDMIEGFDFIVNAEDRILCDIDWIDKDIKNPLTPEEYTALYPIMEKQAMLYIKHINNLWD